MLLTVETFTVMYMHFPCKNTYMNQIFHHTAWFLYTWGP